VTNIISLGEKLRLFKDQKAAEIHKRKILAVKKLFQCSHCAFKCEKCGTQLSTTREGTFNREPNPRIPYRFCESCSEEYLDFIERLKGGGDPDSYWHNDAWLGVWKSWIDYQSSLDNYLKSKEFLRLLREMKQPTPDR